jgi:hypothetical protein
VHQFDLHGGIDRLLFVLQTVARTDFDQGDVGWEHDLSLAFSGDEGQPPKAGDVRDAAAGRT